MYSQFHEDDEVLKIVEARRSAGGRILDIGSWHPVDKSNSRALIERGWSAVMIEPSPGPLLNIVRGCLKCGHVPAEVYGERKAVVCSQCQGPLYGLEPERITIISAAVGLEPGLVRIQITDDAVSTSDDAVYQTWQAIGGYFGYVLVPVITLEQISMQFGGFDVVSFDAEGTSVDLAIRYLAIGCRPLVMVVEHDGRLVELLQVTEAHGYHAVKTNGTNVVVTL